MVSIQKLKLKLHFKQIKDQYLGTGLTASNYLNDYIL